MSWVTFWKFLHIACMFGAVGLFVGAGILNNRVQQTGDVRAIRTVIAAESRIAPVAGVLMMLGIIFGFVTAVAGGFDLLAPWLVVTYGLVLVIILIGALYHGPHDKKLEEAATESGEAQPSVELLTLIAGTTARRTVNVVFSGRRSSLSWWSNPSGSADRHTGEAELACGLEVKAGRLGPNPDGSSAPWCRPLRRRSPGSP